MRFDLSALATTVFLSSQLVPAQEARVVLVKNDSELRSALGRLEHGTVLRIAAGNYSGGNHVSGIRKLTVEAATPQVGKPLFRGGNTAWQFSQCENLTVRDLQISGQRNNGINVDDGGILDKLILGVRLEGLSISDIGPQGNCDGIKASGLKQLTITNCQIHGWSGQGIDFVGCHDSIISNCLLTGKQGFNGSAGIQLKGGSANVTITKCRFINAGERPLNIGGSTGLAYFRPQGVSYEARNISVADCIIEGGRCSAGFVGVDGATFSGNTILYPTKWIFRILQESQGGAFTPCRNVRIENNRITFRRSAVNTEINIGPATKPETFTFSGNTWFAEDRPDHSRPKLPVQEFSGAYGKDPREAKK